MKARSYTHRFGLFKRSQKAQSLVEFALVVPILILIVMGIIEFGNLWMNMNIVTNASREGARLAAVTAPDAGQVQASVNNILNSANMTADSIIITGPVAVTNEVTVTVQVTYTPITGGIVPGLAGLVLQRATTMRWEG